LILSRESKAGRGLEGIDKWNIQRSVEKYCQEMRNTGMSEVGRKANGNVDIKVKGEKRIKRLRMSLQLTTDKRTQTT
jgi:DNA-binding protein YbaB